MKNIRAIKEIPVADVLEYLGYCVRKSGKWLSVKGDNSLKADVQRNTYTDFSGRLGKGSVIDLVMNTLSISFDAACEMLSAHFLGVIPENGARVPSKFPKKNETQKNMTKKYIDGKTAQVLLDTRFYPQNNFFVFLSSRFAVEPARVAALDVGTSKDGHAVFLYRNVKGEYEFLKVVPYDRLTGKRCGNIFTPKGYTQSDGYTANCFFNESAILSAQYVFVVESEKTAVIGTLHFNNPQFAFVATGGTEKLAALLRNKADILAEKSVILLPDNDEAGLKWIDVANSFKSDLDIHAWILDADSPPKSDLADLILSESKTWSETFEKQMMRLKNASKPCEPLPEGTPASVPTCPPKKRNPQISESQRYWLLYDEKKREERERYEAMKKRLDTLREFFDKQILPDVVYFPNEDGYIYETLRQPEQFVVRCLAIAEMSLSEKNERGFETYCCYLEKLKNNIVSGKYLLVRSDAVPF